MKPVLIAIGGNALFDTVHGNNIDPMRIQAICAQIADAVAAGYQPVITFGNGPQVGNLLEMAEQTVRPPKWPIPLDVCVAWTQAEIGYTLTKALANTLAERGLAMPVIAANTTVLVDADDPAMLQPTKFVGNFFTEEQAKQLFLEQGWQMKQDSNRGFRRVVPSPKPITILEEAALRELVAKGCLVLCGGGGGIPVADEEGVLRGIEAVIDKDYTACLLAERMGIPELVICTGVDYVYLNFGTPEQQALETVPIAEARQHLADGQFPPGSMGPKVEALVQFLEHGGQRAIMTRLENLTQALSGQVGTRFVP